MNIAMVSEHASPLAALGGVDAGGQNVFVAALAAALGQRGASVTVYTRRDDHRLPARVPLVPGVTVHHVDAGPPVAIPKDELLPHMGAFADVLSRQWRRDPPDVVHAHFWMSGRAALAAARPLGIPVVQTFHALGVVKRRHQGVKDTSPPERIGVESKVIRQADRILATCSDEVFELTRLGADRARISVVPAGVDLTRFTPDGPAEPRSPGRCRLVAVTRLVERKGLADVIAALEHIPDTELVVAGGPPSDGLQADPEARRLRAVAERHGVTERVVLRGRVDNAHVPALLRSADAVVCAPWYEPFGMVAVEGMACGVPVVATAVGGHVDTLVDGQTGILVPPRDPEGLARAVRDLLRRPDHLAWLGSCGARRARERYSWGRVAALTHEAYRGLARRGPTREVALR
jgi:D-inositol-3-phosphate glycosyltransferase